MLNLEIEARDVKANLTVLRTAARIPAVFYGHKESPIAISVNAKVADKLWKAAGETTLVTLTGVGAPKETLIKDVQIHPVSGALMHMDFYVLEKGKKIEVMIPLEFINDAPAEKLGFIVVKALQEIEIEVSPSELPHTLDVDLSKLMGMGDHITAADIALPPSARLMTDSETIIASVTAFEEYVEQEIPTEAAPASELKTPEEVAAAKAEKKSE